METETQPLVLEAEIRAAEIGLTPTELCRRVGIARSTWTRWKSGEREPQIKKWREVMRELEIATAQQSGSDAA